MRVKYTGERPCQFRGAVFNPNKISDVSDEIGRKLVKLPDWHEVKRGRKPKHGENAA